MNSWRWWAVLTALGIALSLILWLWKPARLGAETEAPATFLDSVRQQIQARINARNGQGGFDCGGEPICAVSLIPAFYEQRQFAPFWIDDKGLKPSAQKLLRATAQAEADGLNPNDYHVSVTATLILDLEARFARHESGQEARWAELDLLLTDAFLLFGAHLSGGRVNPQTLHTDWLLTQHSVDMMAALNSVLNQDQLDQTLEQMRPVNGGYAQLRAALQQLRMVALDGGWLQVPTGPTLKPKEHNPRVIPLRQRLIQSGDLAPDEVPENPEYFDPALSAGVSRFQHRHGLEPDGAAGRKTTEAINVPVAARIRQVELNLERIRWLPSDLGPDHIWVNTADFNLKVVEQNQVVLRMRVVVGRPARRTPVFSALMTYMVINPYWTVTDTIIFQDMLPRIREDAAYFEKENIKVYYGWEEGSAAIDPTTIDWKAYGKGNFPFRLVQDPGPSNSLGRYKFMFPNKFSVYLHDTPHRELFGKSKRDFSSGCIRIENAAGLAAYLFRDNPEWTAEKIKTVLDSMRQQVALVKKPIPVHLVYMTAWVDDSGVLQFRNDIYDRDTELDLALKTRPHSEPPALEMFIAVEEN